MWPFKWKLSTCTVAFCYLFCKMLQNEICKLGQNLPLATFGSERVNDVVCLYTDRSIWRNWHWITTLHKAVTPPTNRDEQIEDRILLRVFFMKNNTSKLQIRDSRCGVWNKEKVWTLEIFILVSCRWTIKGSLSNDDGEGNENGNKAIAGLHVTHGGHVGGQEQKHFSPLGTKLYFRVHKLYFHAH